MEIQRNFDGIFGRKILLGGLPPPQTPLGNLGGLPSPPDPPCTLKKAAVAATENCCKNRQLKNAYLGSQTVAKNSGSVLFSRPYYFSRNLL